MVKRISWDKYFIETAKLISKRGTCPRLKVGAVIVKDGSIISMGYHHKAGKDHAEIDAIKNSPFPVRDSTLYVTLEPCTVYGRTPPCVDEIIKMGFRKVVVGAADPNPEVNGEGLRKLEDAGVEVISGLYKEEVQKQNEVFFRNMTAGMPFVCAKIASSIDGRLATPTSDSRWITGASSRKKVQGLRWEYGCVLTGINTVLADDPALFPRRKLGGNIGENMDAFLASQESRGYTRVILDSKLRIPPGSVLSRTSDRIRTVVFTGSTGKKTSHNRNLYIEQSSSGKWKPEDILKLLYDKYSITSVMLEAGPRVLTSFLTAGLIDKFMVFIAPRIIGGDSSYTMFKNTGVENIKDSIGLRFDSFESSGNDILITAYPLKKKGL